MTKTVRNVTITALVVIVLVIGAVVMKSRSTDSSNLNVPQQNQTTQTPIRHDNSGAGTSSEEGNPFQDHFNHALQHLGL